MKIIKGILAVYSFIFIFTLTAVSVKDGQVSFLFLLPIIFHFILSFWKRIIKIDFRLLDNAIGIYGIIFALIFFWANIFSAGSIREIFFAFLYFPIAVYFVFSIKIFFKREIKLSTSKAIVLLRTENLRGKDEARRKFIKILAGVGLGTFLLYLINPKKAGGAFFGSIPGPGTIAIKDTTGTKIDPAIKSPTDAYGLMNVIDTGDYPYYYGFVNKDGAWYIMKEVGDGSFLYAKGTSGYNWANRAADPPTGPTYASYDATF